VHLNLPFREPLVGATGELPEAGATAVVEGAADRLVPALLPELLHGRVLVVAGRGATPGPIAAMAQARGWPVLADARSGCRHIGRHAVTAADAILRDPAAAAELRPDVVLHVGEPPASRVVQEWLAATRAVHVVVTGDDHWIDPQGVVAHRVVADPASVCAALAGLTGAAGQGWLELWERRERRAQQAFDAVLGHELSEPYVARHIAGLLPRGAHLVVASSMPIRDVEWYGLVPEGVTVHANRGANGIDGTVATGLGVAIASRSPTAVLLGDVALVHDSASLTALARRRADLRIVVLDNDGGGIFEFLAQASQLDRERFEQLFGTPHGTDIVALARAHGLPTVVAATPADLAGALAVPGPSLTYVRSDRRVNVAVHRRLHDAVLKAG
jgi:2-succinyl-5-enolpyruvyl-6-hydroxy-3-cyclohexene-1-carboxylate synthase